MDPTLAKVKQGEIKGKIAQDYKGGKYFSFQGIPFAKPPVGDLRFRAPQPPEPWQGVKDCTKEGSECLSKDFFDRSRIVGSEDCLHLNVYTPEMPSGSGKLKPVMFWIHGGGFTMGSSKTAIYGPDYLMTGDVVLVTTNYRLGIFGFLSLEDPTLGVPGNNALKDMVQSLKWVKENIKQFNGDPDNITIFGESAGGAATHLLVLSPLAKGLFHKAIIQSGCALNPWAPGTRCAKLIAKEMGFPSENEKEILNMLKSVPADKILEAQMKTYDGVEADKVRAHGYVVEKPSSEPAFLLEEPLDIVRTGKHNHVPIMMGYNSKEGMLSEVWYKGINNFQMFKDFETKVPHRFKLPKGSELSLTIAKKIKEFYYREQEPTMDNLDIFYDLETDRYFSRGIYITAKHQCKSAPEVPIYFYKFYIDRELNFFKKLGQIKSPGAAHCDELGYLFKTNLLPPVKLGSYEDDLIQRMVRIWTNFARCSNPNPVTDDPNFQPWAPITPEQFKYLEINDEFANNVDPDKERMQFWDEISGMVPAAKDM